MHHEGNWRFRYFLRLVCALEATSHLLGRATATATESISAERFLATSSISYSLILDFILLPVQAVLTRQEHVLPYPILPGGWTPLSHDNIYLPFVDKLVMSCSFSSFQAFPHSPLVSIPILQHEPRYCCRTLNVSRSGWVGATIEEIKVAWVYIVVKQQHHDLKIPIQSICILGVHSKPRRVAYFSRTLIPHFRTEHS